MARRAKMFGIGVFASISHAVPILVNNSAPRTTTDGQIVDSHNGGLIIRIRVRFTIYMAYRTAVVWSSTEGCTNSTIVSCILNINNTNSDSALETHSFLYRQGACGFAYNTTISIYSSTDC